MLDFLIILFQKQFVWFWETNILHLKTRFSRKYLEQRWERKLLSNLSCVSFKKHYFEFGAYLHILYMYFVHTYFCTYFVPCTYTCKHNNFEFELHTDLFISNTVIYLRLKVLDKGENIWTRKSFNVLWIQGRTRIISRWKILASQGNSRLIFTSSPCMQLLFES